MGPKPDALHDADHEAREVLEHPVLQLGARWASVGPTGGSRPPLCWRDCVEQREDPHAGHELLQLFCLGAALLDDPAQVEEQLKALQEEERAHPPAARAPEGPARRRAVSSGSGCPRSRCQPPGPHPQSSVPAR